MSFSKEEIKEYFNTFNCICTGNFNNEEGYVMIFDYEVNPFYKLMTEKVDLNLTFTKVTSNILKNTKYTIPNLELSENLINEFKKTTKNDEIKNFSMEKNFHRVHLVCINLDTNVVSVMFYEDFKTEKSSSKNIMLGFFINNPTIFEPVFNSGNVEVSNFILGIKENGKFLFNKCTFIFAFI